MPAIRLLGRKWLFAADDLVFPCVIEIPFRIVWLVLISLVVAHEYENTWLCNSTGPDGWLVRLYLCGTLVLQVVLLLLLPILAYQSARGTITTPRKLVPPLIYINLFMTVIELLLNILGSIWIFSDAIECSMTRTFSNRVIFYLIIITWIRMAILLITIYSFYDPLGSVDYEELQDESMKAWYNKKLVEAWVWRLKWALLLLERDEQSKEAIEETARLLATLYRSTDFVLSDIYAGCVLLRIRQKRLSKLSDETDNERSHYTTDVNKMFTDTPAWMNLEDAYRYLRLSVAAYGWLYVMYNNLCTSCCLLAPYLRCCCHKPTEVEVEGDNCCMCNYAGLKTISKVDDSDIIYLSFTNKVFEVAYYVVAVHEQKSIVVTIRGTISFPDMFTDLAGGSEEFKVEGLPEGSRAHKGMALGASKTMQSVEPVLEKAFETYPDYNLVVTGHSLGAAVAVLLGILLKPKYPNVKVFSFSGPAGLLSREAAKYTESFVMTVGLGDDLVMRLGVLSVQDCRDKLIQSLHATRLPKYRIILKSIKYAFTSIPESDLDATWKNPDNLEAYLLSSPNLPRAYPETERLYIGGRVFHIIRHQSDRKSGKQEPKYSMRWAAAEDFNEIQVMPRMLLDHLPENVYDAVKTVVYEIRTSRARTIRVALNRQ
ncbi:diacylglycerol lipase-beta-like [Achroia grisella]|uniref:diacylglycerol lipase-beta-like n=1 Tax=Achroia grisella TaxID=688607 RepID=UPI0027D2EB0E|nr:diacylglycerol lipase-beta-like [Achroia grisella]XP_059057189.1 diacylglycerol lipase-beta-like [Achroia grisella]XP_059057190.1 diacylglycerol lipase-beta-like [Achroia grisella]XP_059057191.1 diacylglycerol lipase-beta-like [Achroia grisella]